MTMTALVLNPDDGERFGVEPNTIRFLAQSPDHPVAITEVTVPPGFPGPVRHRHAAMFDIFYVLEGEITLRLEEGDRRIGPGGFALVPPGTIHTFANTGSEPACFLNIYQPSGFEQYVKEMGRRMGSGSFPTPEEMREIARPYDFEAV
jgi:mannose-6-phosphate isomerase-like protein (cupin superfamily)